MVCSRVEYQHSVAASVRLAVQYLVLVPCVGGWWWWKSVGCVGVVLGTLLGPGTTGLAAVALVVVVGSGVSGSVALAAGSRIGGIIGPQHPGFGVLWWWCLVW